MNTPKVHSADSSKDLQRLNLENLLHIAESYGLEDEAEHIRDRIRDNKRGLMILVSGEGNFGKSSLINAFSGKDIADVSIVPTTFKVDIYNYSPDGKEYAVVREAGGSAGKRMEIDQVKHACAEEEKMIQMALRSQTIYNPKIIEIEWFRAGLRFGPDLCLVDTPGLAQFLLKAAALPPKRLVKGLGAAYYVEDVWDMWYHRADIVLWCFQANRLSSIETYRALSIITKRYRKTIIPVITKADQVPESDWGKVSGEFQKRYEYIFSAQENRRLYFVCCKNFQKPGAHFGKLLHLLLGYAPLARKQKFIATERFIVDVSNHIEKILCESAERVVSNLQVIADTADEIAIESMRRIERIIKRAQGDVGNFLEIKIAGLDLALLSIYQQLIPLKQPQDALKLLAEQRLREYLEEDQLSENLNLALNKVGKEISDYAIAISKTRALEKARISSSLQITRERFSIRFDIPPSSLKANIKLPPVEFPKGCLVLLTLLSTGVFLGGYLLFVSLITLFP
jgi:hypothetical protein